MYDRHKPIIKWYEYDATKLYRNADAEDTAAYADEQPAEEENTSVTLWFGFTGTPIFEENKYEQKGDLAQTTDQLYGGNGGQRHGGFFR